VVYFGSNKLHRSSNKGDNFETISDDLTNGSKTGNVSYGTLTTISESPLTKGLVYTGSDDGLVYVTKNDGANWENISIGLPKYLWVSRVIASKFNQSTVYVTLNGYRWDNFEPYVYRSDNYGKDWKRICTNLPSEPVNVIKEDVQNKDILYLGTDAGVYVSIDRGVTFNAMKGNLPNVPVHDLAVHPTANELILGTHGRSIYIADITLIQKYKQIAGQNKIQIFDVENVNYNPNWGNRNFDWNYTKPKDLVIPFYCNEKQKLNVTIFTVDNVKVYEEENTFESGINFIKYDLTVNENLAVTFKENFKKTNKPEIPAKDDKKVYLSEGKYFVQITGNTGVLRKEFEVKRKRSP
jgi:hypothetical protein